MLGLKLYSTIAQGNWSAQMESSRKDVERAFGILKVRFRCLKLNILFQNRNQIDQTFFLCNIT
jgi:hypothetical protein